MWNFIRIPSDFWDSMSNQKEFMDDLGSKLEIKTFEDWYQVNMNEFIQNKAQTLLFRYNNSKEKMIMAIYPDQDWEEERFHQKEEGFWKDVNVIILLKILKFLF